VANSPRMDKHTDTDAQDIIIEERPITHASLRKTKRSTLRLRNLKFGSIGRSKQKHRVEKHHHYHEVDSPSSGKTKKFSLASLMRGRKKPSSVPSSPLSSSGTDDLDIKSTPTKPETKFKPYLNGEKDTNLNGKIFGHDLEDLLQEEQREVPLIVDKVIEHLDEHGLNCVGLFRLAGDRKQVTKMRCDFNEGKPIEFTDQKVHTVAALLKQYLRALPKPLLGPIDPWVEISKLECEPEDKLSKFSEQLQTLPKANIALSKVLLAFCVRVAKNAEITKMNEENLSRVLAPNILYRPEGSEISNDPMALVEDSTNAITVVEVLMCKYDLIFGDKTDNNDDNDDDDDNNDDEDDS